MDRVKSYAQEAIEYILQPPQVVYDLEDNEKLIRKMNKVQQVFNIMEFCTNEWKINFHIKNNEADDEKSNLSKCFTNCSSKTFEVKRIESFYKSFE